MPTETADPPKTTNNETPSRETDIEHRLTIAMRSEFPVLSKLDRVDFNRLWQDPDGVWHFRITGWKKEGFGCYRPVFSKHVIIWEDGPNTPYKIL